MQPFEAHPCLVSTTEEHLPRCNQLADFRINDVERASGIDPDKVLRSVSKLKESLTAALQFFQRLFALAREEHFCRRIQIDREMWAGIASLQKPPVYALVGGLLLAVDPVECEVVEEVAVIDNRVAPNLVTPRQHLPVPFFQKTIDQTTDGPQPAAQTSLCVFSSGRRAIQAPVHSGVLIFPALEECHQAGSRQGVIARFDIYAHVQALDWDRGRLPESSGQGRFSGTIGPNQRDTEHRPILR